MTRIAFRTRGGDDYGWGHIARTRLLAEALRDQAPDIELEAVVEGPEWVRRRLAEAMTVRALPACDDTGARAGGVRADVAVIDLLEIDERLMTQMRSQARKLAAFSDMGADIPPADLVIQPQSLAGRSDNRRMLRGPDYFVLDRAYRVLSRPARGVAKAQRLLVCLGGEAHRDVPERIAETLRLITVDWPEVLWVVGRGPDESRRAALAARVGEVRMVEFVDDMPARLEWADCALISGGFIKWEAACCGTPAVLVALVDHQDTLGREFEKTGAARYLGRLEQLAPPAIAASLRELQHDAPARQRMSEAGQRLVDAKGAARVAAAVLTLAAA